MKKCNSCGEINKDNSQFCIKCGKQLSNFTPLCPNCKSIITPDDVFCNKCGKSIIGSGSKQEAAKIETSKYIKKPVVETGRNRNFKIFMGLIGGFTAVVVIVLILVFVIDIGNLTTPFNIPIDEACPFNAEIMSGFMHVVLGMLSTPLETFGTTE